MKHPRRTTLAVSLALALAAAACGDDDDGATAPVDPADTTVEAMDEEMTDEEMTDEESMADESMDEEMMDEESMADLPAWQTMTITDVDGATFTLDDFHGTPVLVEAFATWCPKCRDQLRDTNAFAEAAGDDVQVIALSVETDISPADVADYAADNGFTAVRFAVMTPELLAALVDEFGGTIANPPSTPTFVIDAMGHAGGLETGSASAETLAMRLGLDA